MLLEGIKEIAVNATRSGAAGRSPFIMTQRWTEPSNMLQMGANLTALLGFWAILRQILPFEYIDRLNKWVATHFGRFNSYAFFDIPENIGNGDAPNDLFDAVQAHLSLATAQTAHKASLVRSKGAAKISYAMSAGSDWTLETFQGCHVWWSLIQVNMGKESPEQASRSFTLKIQKKHKEKILDAYLEHVVRNAKLVKQGNRERQLFTNSTGSWGSRAWTSIPFDHPSTFETLALDPSQKNVILDDLRAFVKAEDFYRRVGRAWKRGYLLYGPPGTGKSSMIAAMANFLNYDIYDLELTQVHSNLDLRKLLLHTTSKSIIVIEDIDCTVELPNRADQPQTEEKDVSLAKPSKNRSEKSGVTLSGLLNFTDGIWSCCGSERIIVFTTNHIHKLDPALLRSGRMDMKIHLSYCGFPAFKVLAENYLGIRDHELFPRVEQAMEGAHMTPADVTEHLINSTGVEAALHKLISALEENKLQSVPVEEDAATATRAAEATTDGIQTPAEGGQTMEKLLSPE